MIKNRKRDEGARDVPNFLDQAGIGVEVARDQFSA
jgi:hypothetical protein